LIALQLRDAVDLLRPYPSEAMQSAPRNPLDAQAAASPDQA